MDCHISVAMVTPEWEAIFTKHFPAEINVDSLDCMKSNFFILYSLFSFA